MNMAELIGLLCEEYRSSDLANKILYTLRHLLTAGLRLVHVGRFTLR